MESRRVFYIDRLRLIATLAVVLVHTAGRNWTAVPVDSAAWQAMNVWDGLSRWAVPVFVMISGALFLGRDKPVRAIWRRNIARIAAAFVFWSLLYALWERFVMRSFTGGTAFLTEALLGHYHMWYLFMIAGLYAVVPLLEPIVRDRKRGWYFAALSLVFAFALPQAAGLLAPGCPAAAQALEKLLAKTNLHLVLGYTGYFVLGFLLDRAALSGRAAGWITVLGVLGAAVTVAGTAWLSRSAGAATDRLYSYLSVNVLAFSAAVFVVAKRRLDRPPRRERALTLLSKSSFGVYLMHPLALEALSAFAGVTPLTFAPALSVPALALGAFAVSLAVSAGLNQIPFVKKWLV